MRATCLAATTRRSTCRAARRRLYTQFCTAAAVVGHRVEWARCLRCLAFGSARTKVNITVAMFLVSSVS